MDPRAELADFLKSRRARLKPEDVGLADVGRRRRTPGLRREELASVAGISVDYYTRLEQGRDVRPSLEVLTALGRALRLDDAEQRHLVTLATAQRAGRREPGAAVERVRPSLEVLTALGRALRLDDAEQRHLVTLATAQRAGRREPGAAVERVRPEVQRLVDAMHGTPAFVLGRRMDVLAWNPLAAALIADFGALAPARRNMMLLLFLDPSSRDLYANWTEIARESIAHLRGATGRHPDDQRLAAIVGELSVKSPEFRQLWSGHDVKEKGFGRKEFDHPMVGRLTLDYEAMALSDGQDKMLVTYTAEPDSPSAAALQLLAVIGGERFTERPAAEPVDHAE